MNIPESFWSHIPNWGWPLVMIAVAVFVFVKLIREFEAVAKCFGNVGRKIHDKANSSARVLEHVERIEDILECTTAYLTLDASWHFDADMIIAESYPGLRTLLPHRIPFTEFQRRWREGWRPSTYEEDVVCKSPCTQPQPALAAAPPKESSPNSESNTLR